MLKHRLLFAGSLVAFAAATPAFAADQPVPDSPPVATGAGPATGEQPDETDPANQIVVVAGSLRGQVETPQAPIETLDEADIASYGAASVTDLLAALAPQTGSGRGRGAGMPVMLLNGQRISSFREMRNIPPEAIRRVEILPEEVALKFGYSPDQRVVNIVLKPQFSAFTGELGYGQPWRGGTSTSKGELSLFNVSGQNRLNLTGSYQRTSPLLEGERNLVQANGSLPGVSTDPDPAFARTLINTSSDANLNAVWSRGLGEKGVGGLLTLNATVDRADTLGLSGLNTVVLVGPNGAGGTPGPSAVRTFGDPLTVTTQTDTVSGGVTFNKSLGKWQLTATVDANRAESDTRIERRANTTALVDAAASGALDINGPLPQVATGGYDRAYTTTNTVSSLVTLIGKPVHLPGGDVAMTARAGYSYASINSQDSRSIAAANLTRSDFSVGVNLGIPITSRRENFGGAIGNLTLNLSGGLDHLSDFGTLKDWTVGLTWAPTETLNLQATYIVNEQAPSLNNLGAPQTQTLNVPVYDFSRNETALVTVTGGGNPLLRRETDRDLKFGLNWQLPFLKSSNLIVEYFRNNSDNVTAAFPVLTPDIEAAFPGRVTRQVCGVGAPATCVPGRLLAIDRRPVTFANEVASRLRYGVNVTGNLGKAPPGGMGGMGGGQGGGRGGRGGGMRGGGGGPPGGMMGAPGGQGRWSFSVYHTIQFENRVLVTPGGPVLDLLSGDALTSGGVARQSLEFEGGMFYKGIGLRASGSYTGSTRIDGTGAPGSSDLRFGSLAKLNLRAFIDLGQQKRLTKASSFFKGARLAFRVDNIFDARQKVLDSTGTVPVSYQPDLLDPQGRFIGIELRKQF